MMMTLSILLTIAASVSQSPPAPAPLAPAAPTPAAAMIQARELAAKHLGHAAIVAIGKSWTGLPIEALVLSENFLNAEKQPAILVVSGLDGSRPSSVAVAVAVAAKLLASPTTMHGTTFYIVPCGNPDAFLESQMASAQRANRNAHPTDEDRDGRVDEDRPSDINGDGAITQMRRLAPPPNDPPTHLPDPADPRLMRTPDATKDLRATQTLSIEGLDADLDGLIAEDDLGGVDIDRNFPHLWQEFDRTAGVTQLSEPESQALVRFVLDHPRIIGALVIGRWESLAKLPDARAKDITGKTPLALDSADQAIWEEMGKRWRELSLQARCEESDPAGSLALWLYAHRGIPTFATQLWGRPDPSPLPPATPAATPTAADTTAADTTAAPPTPPTPPPTPFNAEDSLWLQWSDRDQSGRGFLPWTPFDHPTLGKVEIGGFRAGFRSDPPASEIPRLADAVATFLGEFAAKQPRVVLRNVITRVPAPGLLEVEAEIVNEGWLPTASAMGKINKQPSPIMVRLSTPKDRLLSGQRVTKVEALAGAGDRKHFRWIIRTIPGELTALEVVWKPAGTQRIEIAPDATTSATTVTP